VTYYVKVRANNSTESISSSYTATVSASAGVNGMTAPTNLRLTPQNGQVSLTWTAPSNSGTSSIADYTVFYSTTASGVYSPVTTGSTTASKILTGLTNGSNYFFKVAGVNSGGAGIPSSASSGVTPFVLVSAPSGVALQSSSTGSLTFGWSSIVHSGDNYQVWWGTDSTFASSYSYTGTTATSYTINGLTTGQSIYFRVAGWQNMVASDVEQFQTSEWGIASGGTVVP
jgi:hypothetical protein